MTTNLAQIQTIRTQTLALLVTATASMQPTYSIDGQSMSRGEYLKQLTDTIAWCDAQEATTDPFEITTYEL